VSSSLAQRSTGGGSGSRRIGLETRKDGSERAGRSSLEVQTAVADGRQAVGERTTSTSSWMPPCSHRSSNAL
jgi:hypothetical protein